MASLNKVCLIGNLGKDPEIRSFQNGGKVMNLTLATSESWIDKSSGEKKEKTEWHNVVIKNDALIGYAEKALQKGSSVYLEGQIQTRKWTDQSGQDKYTTEIILGPFKSTLQGIKGLRERDEGGKEAYGASKPRGGQTYANKDSWTPSNGDLDDEIPF